MSEDEYGDDIFNSAFLNEVEAIEMGLGGQAQAQATRTSPLAANPPARREKLALRQPTVISLESDDFDMTFNLKFASNLCPTSSTLSRVA